MKKSVRLTAFILFVIFLFSSFSVFSYAAETITKGDFVFTVSGNSLTLTEYKGKGGAVEVPISVGGKTVTAVGPQAFAEYYDSTPDEARITKVILPSTVTTIGKNAFLECTKLSVVEMIGVKSLGEAAFWYCKGLKKVAVSESLRTIGQNAFGKCDNVTIYCEKGSVAEQYAKSNSMKFSALYPEKISFSKKSASVVKGKSVTLKVNVTPSDAYYKELYFSASGKNASVSQSGKVTGKNLGTERISCMSIMGGAVTECVVTVRTAPVKTVTVSDKKFDSLKLNWKKASGAQGYRIEIMKSGKWTKLADTKDLSYKVSGLSAGKEYKFSIRAFVKNNKVTYYSDRLEISAETLKLGNVKNITPDSASSKGLSFSWGKVSKATGYQVWVLGSDGKYTKAADTRGLVFSEALKESTVRTYKVRAYTTVSSKKLYGSFTAPFTYSSKPAKASGLTVSAKTKNSISLKWNSVKSASGYGVYLVKDGKYSLVKKVTSKSITIDGLKSDTKYTYAVRAYIDTSLKTNYGDYSLSVSATTKPAVSASQAAVNDISPAINSTVSSKDFYLEKGERLFVEVTSCSGSSKQNKLAQAYAESFTDSSLTSYNFTGGKEPTGLTPSQLILPPGGFRLKASDIKSVTRAKDGSGTLLIVNLNSEKVSGKNVPPINSGVWGYIDKSVLDEAFKDDGVIESFNVSYTGTSLSMKINQNGKFDTLMITVPFDITVVCNIDGESVKTVFSGRMVREFNISWW